ncbi:hypothetical protein [Tamlana crocina]|uniref:Lipoprotein n=1 Tax=Tamlana crocina TaxID=393006 RepID=A0ABX1DHI4_9FLAO|nr:hypothetical protein [Tamlana crocina]NJX16544.1 hypothetical protein [Tamlana crocina]
MKTLKFITATLLLVGFTLTSCQDNDDNVNPNPDNSNSATSPTASNLKRSSMHKGNFDDFLDGTSCSSILLPVTATVNGTEVTVASESDYETVTDILAEYNNDDDTVVLHFPLTVKLSNHTEVTISNQIEYNALMTACEQAENATEDAINCLDINYPISIFTFNLNLEQTGSVVLESDQELYAYMNDFEDAYFAVNYPITATMSNDTQVTISSDMDLSTKITECLATEDEMEEAEEDAEEVESILVEGAFKVESFIEASVDKANTFADYTITFAGDMSCLAQNTADSTANDIQGIYEVAAETEVSLNINFSSNATLQLLNHSWEVTSYTQNSITLQSSANAAITLVLNRV